MVSIGPNIIVGSNTRAAEEGLEQLKTRMMGVKATADQVNSSMNRAAGGSKAFAGAMNQGAYAVEDFLTVYGTTGFSGGMRAAANNLSMVARSMAGPIVGGIAGIGFALVSLVPTLMQTKDAVDEFAISLDQLMSRYDGVIDRQLRLSQMELNLGGRVEDLKTTEGADKELKSIERQVEALNLEDEARAKKIKRLKDEEAAFKASIMSRKKSQFHNTPLRELASEDEMKKLKEFQDKRKKLMDDQKESQGKREILKDTYDTIIEVRPSLEDKEYEKFQKDIKDEQKRAAKEKERLEKEEARRKEDLARKQKQLNEEVRKEMKDGYEQDFDNIVSKLEERMKKAKELFSGEELQQVQENIAQATLTQLQGLKGKIMQKQTKPVDVKLASAAEATSAEGISMLNKAKSMKSFADEQKLNKEQLDVLKMINDGITALKDKLGKGVKGVQVGS